MMLMDSEAVIVQMSANLWKGVNAMTLTGSERQNVAKLERPDIRQRPFLNQIRSSMI